MITITIEGPPASGKTRFANALQDYCMRIGKTCILKEEITEAALAKNLKSIDVLISTRLKLPE